MTMSATAHAASDSALQLEPGTRIRVRDDYPFGHFRTPVYVRGKPGVVLRCLGTFADPELLAYRLDGPPRRLYVVRFQQVDLWNNYQGPDRDTVDIDLYEHWLEPVREPLT